MPKYPGISPYDNEKGTLGTAKKRWEKLYVKEIESDTVSGMEAEIENLATTATNSVAAAVSAKNDAVAAKTAAEAAQTAAETAAAGIQSVVETDVDNTLSIAGVAADAKVTGDWLRDIAKPVTLDTSMPATAVANEYMKVTTDSEGRVLYGVKRDGTFTWQKGVPKHLQDKINELAAPVIDNNEYMYVMLDSEDHVLFGVKRDGSFDWQKGLPKPVKEKLEEVAQLVIDSEEFVQLTQDADGRIICGIKRDGSFFWAKGIPQHLVNYIDDSVKKYSKEGIPRGQSARIFLKVCCCGDSYTAGYISERIDGGIINHNTNEDYAWPHYAEKLSGNTWYNCGHSGATVLTWQTVSRGLPKATSLGKVQAYVIGLGINDSYRVPLGTVNDIGTDAQTYYGGMSSIVTSLKEISPKAKILICTVPREGSRYAPYNEAVRNIVEYYKNTISGIHCIDLYEHRDMFEKGYIADDKIGNHYTAIGYEYFAEGMFTCISEYINNHITEFQDVPFIPYD